MSGSKKKRVKWTDEEHELFVAAIKEHQREWKKVQEAVGTKTIAQIRSHAQKYFIKLEKEGKFEDIPLPKCKNKAIYKEKYADLFQKNASKRRRDSDSNTDDKDKVSTKKVKPPAKLKNDATVESVLIPPVPSAAATKPPPLPTLNNFSASPPEAHSSVSSSSPLMKLGHFPVNPVMYSMPYLKPGMQNMNHAILSAMLKNFPSLRLPGTNGPIVSSFPSQPLHNTPQLASSPKSEQNTPLMPLAPISAFSGPPHYAASMPVSFANQSVKEENKVWKEGPPA